MLLTNSRLEAAMPSKIEILKQHWPEVYAAFCQAEQFSEVNPVVACFQARRALELMLERAHLACTGTEPQRLTILDIMNVPTIRDSLESGKHMQDAQRVRKVGNAAVHKGSASPEQAALLCKDLYSVVSWFLCVHGLNASMSASIDDQTSANAVQGVSGGAEWQAASSPDSTAQFETENEYQEDFPESMSGYTEVLLTDHRWGRRLRYATCFAYHIDKALRDWSVRKGYSALLVQLENGHIAAITHEFGSRHLLGMASMATTLNSLESKLRGQSQATSPIWWWDATTDSVFNSQFGNTLDQEVEPTVQRTSLGIDGVRIVFEAAMRDYLTPWQCDITPEIREDLSWKILEAAYKSQRIFAAETSEEGQVSEDRIGISMDLNVSSIILFTSRLPEKWYGFTRYLQCFDVPLNVCIESFSRATGTVLVIPPDSFESEELPPDEFNNDRLDETLRRASAVGLYSTGGYGRGRYLVYDPWLLLEMLNEEENSDDPPEQS